jgi:DNA polymerase
MTPKPRLRGPGSPAQVTRTPAPVDRDQPASAEYERLHKEAAGCHACPLWANATQTIFGEGKLHAGVMLVGEQPGDQEDLAGHVFVGPAGRVLDRALAEAGIAREALYVTNAVKHFKNEARGKRRLHKKPNTYEIDACNMWLRREIELVGPRVLVALGATAARALAGKPLSIGRERGRLVNWGTNRKLLVTVHPSFLLRIREQADRQAEFRRFVADLRVAAAA